jgi:putative endonuclease
METLLRRYAVGFPANHTTVHRPVSCVSPKRRHYVGLTSDVGGRLHWRNEGPSGVTRASRPWSLVVSLEFGDATITGRFERYLKTGSGRAFARRVSAGGRSDSCGG